MKIENKKKRRMKKVKEKDEAYKEMLEKRNEARMEKMAVRTYSHISNNNLHFFISVF